MATTVLVSMPWQAVDSQSLPLAILRAVCQRAGLPAPVIYHGGIHWCEHLMRESNGAIGVADYVSISEGNNLFDGVGDWIFAGVLNGDPQFGEQRFADSVKERGVVNVALATSMRMHAESFLRGALEDVLAYDPDVVGFTTTFMQNVPSLALAKLLRAAKPDVRIVFGGSNCDGDMGAALHRNFPFVDYVVRGEGERTFPQLLRTLDGAGNLADIPGLCWRDNAGVHVNPATSAPIPADDVPVPDYDDWFEVIAKSPIAPYIEPKLVLETSRGCWWGEKHHCTFCGLNGSLMKFRAKSPDRVLSEMSGLVARHRVLDVMMVDNIMDNSYFNSVLPKIAELGWDLRIHYEVKSNLTAEQIEQCRRAHVAHVQPGIESLVSPALQLMNKGVSAIRNLRTLRDCESASVTVDWNWLYGFTGERFSDYLPVIDQLPALHHLQPPSAASRIALERFSPNFDNPLLGFSDRKPAKQYHYLYDLPTEELSDLVYLFDTRDQGLTEEEVAPLRTAVFQWTHAYPHSSLEMFDEAGSLVIVDRRVGWERVEFRLNGVFADAYRELEQGRSESALHRKLTESGNDLIGAELSDWLALMLSRGLVFTENGQYLALATRLVPIKMTESA